MSCDTGARQAEVCMGKAGVPSAISRTAWALADRCPNCGAFVGASGVCNHPRCSRLNKSGVGVLPSADFVGSAERVSSEVSERPNSGAYSCPDCGSTKVDVTAWEAELTTRYLDDGEEVAAATRHGDAYTRRVRALHCDECGKEADRERGDSLQAWNEDIGPREWPDRSVILTSPCCPECGSKEVDVTAWENRLVTRHVDGDEEVAAPDIQGDAYTEGVVRVRCVDCSLVADAEKGDDVGVWQEVTLRDIRRVTGPGWCLSTFENCAPPENDRWTSWEAALEAGRRYMVGDRVPIDEFVQRHRSPMLRWQQVAYRWAVQHPDRMLIAENDTNCWQVYRRGEYVELGLPHHDAGGVRYYISRNGRSKVRVNQD